MCAKPAWLIFVIFFCIAQSVHGQNALRDSALKNEAVDAYNAVMADQLEFYNGAEYKLYPVAYKGSPYFEGKNHCTPSMIRYNGTWYKDGVQWFFPSKYGEPLYATGYSLYSA